MTQLVRRWGAVLAVALLLVVPLFTVSVWLYRNDRWAPVFDFAMTEVRVRDVGTAHTPLLGLPGRLGTHANGSHPGPLSFYLLAPIYRLLGGSYWALRVSTATFNAVAIVAALLIARRRAGTPGVLAAGLAIAFLELGYGLLILTEPWNPHLPVLWFIVFLLAIWSVVCSDSAMLPVAAASGSLCAQTHVPYLAVCGGVGLLGLAWVGGSWVRALMEGSSRREHARSLLAAMAVVVTLWAPPIIEQLFHEPGNLRILVDFFTHPPTASLGVRTAARLLVEHLDGWYLIVDSLAEPGLFARFMDARHPSFTRGGVFLGLWLGAAVIALKIGSRPLLALHGLVLASLLVELAAISRIVGVPWHYLMFCAWGIGALVLCATLWSVALGAGGHLPERFRIRRRFVSAWGAVVLGACVSRLALSVTKAGSSLPNPSLQLAELAPATAAAIRAKVGASTGTDGRYLVAWLDTLYFGAQGMGLVNELERRGLPSGLSKEFGGLMTSYRVMRAPDATALVLLATGGWMDDARKLPGAIQVAFSDPRSPAERRESDEQRAIVAGALRSLGHEDAVGALDRNPSAANVPGMGRAGLIAAGRLGELGMPAAVFIVPVRPP